MGAAPGSWLQVASEAIGEKGLAIGVDLTPIDRVAKNVKTIVGDITDPKTVEQFSALGPFDAIISDAAPNTSGVKVRDQAQSAYLIECVLALAESMLRPGGAVVMKIFQSSDMPQIQKLMKTQFKKAHIFKPRASRERSFETYLIGIGKK